MTDKASELDEIRTIVAGALKTIAAGKFDGFDPSKVVVALVVDKFPDATVGQLMAAVNAEAELKRSVLKILGNGGAWLSPR